MKAIIINKKIQLVQENELIELSLLVPARNLQAMRDQTGCRIISKIPCDATFRHNAGKLYLTKIKVRYSKVAPFLKECNYKVAENADVFASLFYSSQNYIYIPCDSIGLYTFGDCSSFESSFKSSHQMNVLYYSSENNRISLYGNILNDFGDKRYIKFKGYWYSNRKF